MHTMNSVAKTTTIIKEADIDDTRTWTRYSRSLCSSCAARCCTLIVEVSTEDMINCGYASLWETQHDMKGLVKSLKKQGIIKRYNIRTEKFVLEQTAKGECIFLDERKLCSIYDRRPRVCREHPDVAGPRRGFCPYRLKN